MLPHKLKAFVAYIDGQGYAGQCKEFTVPKLSRKMDEYRSGGMDAPVEIDLGMEKLTAELTMGEAIPALVARFGEPTIDGVRIRLMGSTETDDTNNIVPVEIVIGGRFSEIDVGNWKAGDSSQTKYSCAVSYFKYVANNTDLIEIDVPNLILKVNGVDIYAKRHAACGLSY
jgi:P2 family phage contractile tail tube protein